MEARLPINRGTYRGANLSSEHMQGAHNKERATAVFQNIKMQMRHGRLPGNRTTN